MVKLTWVVDDVADAPLRAEHGFALWIEMAQHRVLFDTGGSGAVLLHNLEVLGLDPTTLDAVVLSHAHDDHTGGLQALLPYLRLGTPLYAHPALFEPRYTGDPASPQSRGIGFPPAHLAERVSLRLDDRPQEVTPGLWTTGEIRTRSEPEGRSSRHFVLREGRILPDPYLDDLSLTVEVGPGQRFLLCGCCHAGLLNTLATVEQAWSATEVTGIVGGVHLVNASHAVAASTAARLAAMPSLAYLWLGHCSGSSFLDHATEVMAGGMVEVWRSTAGHTLDVMAETIRCD